MGSLLSYPDHPRLRKWIITLVPPRGPTTNSGIPSLNTKKNSKMRFKSVAWRPWTLLLTRRKKKLPLAFVIDDLRAYSVEYAVNSFHYKESANSARFTQNFCLPKTSKCVVSASVKIPRSSTKLIQIERYEIRDCFFVFLFYFFFAIHLSDKSINNSSI